VKNLLKDRSHWLEVWARFRTGNQVAFSEIYEEFIDRLMAYGSKITRDRELVKDCIQDIFIDLYRLQPDLRNPEYIEFYLFKSLKNSIVRKAQKDKKLKSLSEEEMIVFDLNIDVDRDVFDLESDQLRIERLKSIVQTLDPQKRELLFLKFNSEMNYNEIGQLLNINPDAAKKQVYRLLDQIREKYGVQLLELFVILKKG
jgi:RNA polymerase sigma factor (sigma-70 family)